MANLSLSGGTEEFTWTISGLSNPFNTSWYISAGITNSYFANGASSVSGVVSSRNAPSSGSSTSVSRTVSYSPGTYTFYAYAQAANGLYYQAGSGTVTVHAPQPVIDKFYWSNAQPEPIASGYPLVIRATAWNAMIGKIAQILGYHLPTLTVSAGTNISASLYNAVVGQLKGINSGVSLSTVTAGVTTITAARINALQTAINYIIDRL